MEATYTVPTDTNGPKRRAALARVAVTAGPASIGLDTATAKSLAGANAATLGPVPPTASAFEGLTHAAAADVAWGSAPTVKKTIGIFPSARDAVRAREVTGYRLYGPAFAAYCNAPDEADYYFGLARKQGWQRGGAAAMPGAGADGAGAAGPLDSASGVGAKRRRSAPAAGGAGAAGSPSSDAAAASATGGAADDDAASGNSDGEGEPASGADDAAGAGEADSDAAGDAAGGAGGGSSSAPRSKRARSSRNRGGAKSAGGDDDGADDDDDDDDADANDDWLRGGTMESSSNSRRRAPETKRYIGLSWKVSHSDTETKRHTGLSWRVRCGECR